MSAKKFSAEARGKFLNTGNIQSDGVNNLMARIFGPGCMVKVPPELLLP